MSHAENKTFAEAQQSCITRGGNLVTIRSEQEGVFVRSQLRVDLRGLAWIGLTELNNNTIWLSGDAAQYKNLKDDDHWNVNQLESGV